MKKRRSLIVLTIVNILILIMSIYCLIRTTQNCKFINSNASEFVYEEYENGKVILTLEEEKRITLQFGNSSVKVVQSYQATSREESISVMLFIRYYTRQKGLKVHRSNTQILGEYRLHNLLYTVGYKRANTGDADIDLVKDKRWYVNVLSSVWGWIGA